MTKRDSIGERLEGGGRITRRKSDSSSLPPADLSIPPEGYHEKLLKKSIESKTSSSGSSSEKRSMLNFWSKLVLYFKTMKMRYLRVLRKKDFEDLIGQEIDYVELVRERDGLTSQETECQSNLDSAASKGKEYAELLTDLQKFDNKLQRVYDQYVSLRDERKALVDDVNARKAELHDKARGEIVEYSRRLKFLKSSLVTVHKTIASYRNKRYSEICDARVKRKVTDS